MEKMCEFANLVVFNPYGYWPSVYLEEIEVNIYLNTEIKDPYTTIHPR